MVSTRPLSSWRAFVPRRAAGAGDLHLNGVLCMERMDRGKLSRAGRVDGHGISPGNRDSTSLTPGPDNWSSVALQHVGITVSDVDASVRFWSAFLGRRPRARPVTGPGLDQVLSLTDGRTAALVHEEPAAHVDRRSRNVASVIARKEDDHAGDVLGLAHVAKWGFLRHSFVDGRV